MEVETREDGSWCVVDLTEVDRTKLQEICSLSIDSHDVTTCNDDVEKR